MSIPLLPYDLFLSALTSTGTKNEETDGHFHSLHTHTYAHTVLELAVT